MYRLFPEHKKCLTHFILQSILIKIFHLFSKIVYQVVSPTYLSFILGLFYKL